MGESGSVTWLFENKGIIVFNRGNKSEEEIMEGIIPRDIISFIEVDQYQHSYLMKTLWT